MVELCSGTKKLRAFSILRLKNAYDDAEIHQYKHNMKKKEQKTYYKWVYFYVSFS